MLLCEYVLNSTRAPPSEAVLYHTLLQLYLAGGRPAAAAAGQLPAAAGRGDKADGADAAEGDEAEGDEAEGGAEGDAATSQTVRRWGVHLSGPSCLVILRGRAAVLICLLRCNCILRVQRARVPTVNPHNSMRSLKGPLSNTQGAGAGAAAARVAPGDEPRYDPDHALMLYSVACSGKNRGSSTRHAEAP